MHKDIGDILEEAQRNKFDDDEDEEDSVANGERYDRFRSGEKSKDDAKKDEEQIIEKTEEKMVVDTEKE